MDRGRAKGKKLEDNRCNRGEKVFCDNHCCRAKKVMAILTLKK